VGREQGASAEKLRALDSYAGSPLFTAKEKAALAYADGITQRREVEAPTYAALKQQFDDDAIVELTAAISWEICASTFNRALEIEAQGVCLITKTEA